jgi:hypothetical protein
MFSVGALFVRKSQRSRPWSCLHISLNTIEKSAGEAPCRFLFNTRTRQFASKLLFRSSLLDV